MVSDTTARRNRRRRRWSKPSGTRRGPMTLQRQETGILPRPTRSWPLDSTGACSHSVLMAVLTLGEAWKLGWRVRARCLWGGPDPHSRHNRISIECDTTVRLDMETLVWTRGDKFPLDQLSSRLKCPKCGERRVQVYFEVPGEPKARTVRAAGCPSKASRRTSPVGRSRTK